MAAFPPDRRSGFNLSFVVQGSSQEKKGPLKIWPATSHAAQAPALRVRASFSQERMTYIPEESKVIYQSKDGKQEKVFDALEWPHQKAAGCKHSPPCAPMSRIKVSPARRDYYGHYSNVSRGKRNIRIRTVWYPPSSNRMEL